MFVMKEGQEEIYVWNEERIGLVSMNWTICNERRIG
jgi:hypothetical protein